MCRTASVTDADRLRTLIGAGAQVLVCGGREMAAGVRETLGELLVPPA